MSPVKEMLVKIIMSLPFIWYWMEDQHCWNEKDNEFNWEVDRIEDINEIVAFITHLNEVWSDIGVVNGTVVEQLMDGSQNLVVHVH